jgi:hypothetical protein
MFGKKDDKNQDYDRDFVTACYQSILGREPDEAGLVAHMDGLNGPRDYIRLIETFCDSSEFKARVLMKRPRLEASHEKRYFVHIHKTGGTTIHDWLLYQAAPGRVFPGFFVNDLIRNMRILDSLDIFSGHFYNTLDLLLDCKTRKATLFRDPADRMISRYYHVMRNKGHSLYPVFEGMTLEEATASQRHRRMIGENLQAKVVVQVTSTEDEPLRPRQLDLLGEEELYRRARAAIDEFELVGVLEHVDEFVRELARLWDLPEPDALQAKNVNTRGSTSDVDPELKERIRALNTVDDQLYRDMMTKWA